MSDKGREALVPTSGMDFNKQVLIMRAYVVLTKRGTNPVHYLEVVRRGKLARTQVSGVNSFFVGLGILKEMDVGIYVPTKEAVEAFDGAIGEEKFMALRVPLMKSRLFEFVRDQIMIHGLVSLDDIAEQLLEESGANVKTRVQRAIQWLQNVGLILVDESGRVVITAD